MIEKIIFFLENKPIDSKILVDQIKNIISDYSTDILVISADKEVAYGKVVEVIDQIRSIDNLRIGMSTDKWISKMSSHYTSSN